MNRDKYNIEVIRQEKEELEAKLDDLRATRSELELTQP